MTRRGRRGGVGRPPVHIGDATTRQGRDGPDLRLIRSGENIDMGEIGGEVREGVTAWFLYFGHRLRVNPDLTEIEVIDLLEEAQQVDVKDPRSMTMTKDYARAHVHEDDFDEFWDLVKANHQDTSAVMITCWKILDGITANPTGGQSGSSDGQPVTKPSSPRTSSPPASDRSPREAYLSHIERFEAMTDGDGNPAPIGAAMAAQLAVAAAARGIDVSRDPSVRLTDSA